MAPANVFFIPFQLLPAISNRFENNVESTLCLELLALTCSMSSGISGMIPVLIWENAARGTSVSGFSGRVFVRSALTGQTEAKNVRRSSA